MDSKMYTYVYAEITPVVRMLVGNRRSTSIGYLNFRNSMGSNFIHWSDIRYARAMTIDMSRSFTKKRIKEIMARLIFFFQLVALRLMTTGILRMG